MSLHVLHNLKQKQKHMPLHSWLPWCEPRLTDLKPGDFVEVIQLCFLFLDRVISKAVDCGIAPDGNTICPKQSPISISTYKNIICLKAAFPVLWTHECAQLSHKHIPIFCNVVCTLHVYQVIVRKLVQHSAHVYAVKLYSDVFCRWPPPPWAVPVVQPIIVHKWKVWYKQLCVEGGREI